MEDFYYFLFYNSLVNSTITHSVCVCMCVYVSKELIMKSFFRKVRNKLRKKER